MLKTVLLAGAALSLIAGVALAQPPAAEHPTERPGGRPASAMQAEGKKPDAATAEPNAGVLFKPERVDSDGVVTVEGQAIPYHAVAGTIVVHPRGWDDAARREAAPAGGANLGAGGNPEAEASMFYVAYFKNGTPGSRPADHLFSTTAVPVRQRCGCTWGLSGRSGSSGVERRSPHARGALLA